MGTETASPTLAVLRTESPSPCRGEGLELPVPLSFSAPIERFRTQSRSSEHGRRPIIPGPGRSFERVARGFRRPWENEMSGKLNIGRTAALALAGAATFRTLDGPPS